jgi:ABC-type Zn2+ transport system substrate-binding protein/surface adhesin
MKALRDHLAANPATCAFTAPQENEGLLRTAIEGQGTRVAVLDPLGDGEQPYTALLQQFADNMTACFDGA